MTGYSGWAFLKRTQESQMRTFKNSFEIRNDINHYTSKIDSVKNADDLINDHKLLKVSLGAFGLSDDINSQFFVKRILEGGTTSRDALSNKMADSRYKELSKFFSFGNPIPSGYTLKYKIEKITEDYAKVKFEEAIGEQDESIRIALFGNRTLQKIANNSISEKSKWLMILGNPPLRKIFETSLNLPSTFSQIDLDQQVRIITKKSRIKLKIKTPSDLKEKDLISSIIDKFILQSEIKNSSKNISSESIALSLLQAIEPQKFY